MPVGSTAATRSVINPIGSEIARSCSVAVTVDSAPRMRARLGRRSPTPASAPTAFFRVVVGRGRGDGLDQVVHRAVEDVQQRHQDLQAQPFGALDDEPVDLARGQGDARASPAARSDRWWRTCRGRPSPGAGASGSPAWRAITVLVCRVDGANAGASALLQQRCS